MIKVDLLTLSIDIPTGHARDLQFPQVFTNAILCNKKHLLDITVKKSQSNRNRLMEGKEGGGKRDGRKREAGGGVGECMPKAWPCLASDHTNPSLGIRCGRNSVVWEECMFLWN